MSATVIHSVRLLTGHEDVADVWVLLAAGRVAARGTGHSWREALAVVLGAGNRGWAEANADADVVDGTGLTIVPGFIDMHCHGGDGASFGDSEPGAIERALAVHRRHGTTRAVLSLVTAPIAELAAQLARIRALTGEASGILGSHLEGPFLAAEFKGAHDANLLRAADSASIERLLTAADGTLAQVTLAPELPGALAAIARMTAAGVKVAVGHTAVDYDEARAAFEAGATILTHAFNGMKGIHHRAPGPVAAGMAEPRVTLELINDGVHVHPDVVRLVFAGAPGRVALVTDAMAATGCAGGCYLLGTLKVEVQSGAARLVGSDTIAGSTLTLDVALKRAVETCGVPLQQAVSAVTHVPARALGVEDRYGDLAVGYAADAVLLTETLEVASVWAGGVRI